MEKIKNINGVAYAWKANGEAYGSGKNINHLFLLILAVAEHSILFTTPVDGIWNNVF